MAGKKLQDLPYNQPLTGTELIYAVQNNTDVKITTSSLIYLTTHGVGVTQLSDNIAPANISTLLGIYTPTALSPTAKWMITIIDTVTQRTQAFELFSLYKSLTNTVVYSKTNIIGDIFSINISLIMTGPHMSLHLINNEATDLTVQVTRLTHV